MKPKRRFHRRGRWFEYGFEWWYLPRGRTLVLTVRRRREPEG